MKVQIENTIKKGATDASINAIVEEFNELLTAMNTAHTEDDLRCAMPIVLHFDYGFGSNHCWVKQRRTTKRSDGLYDRILFAEF